MTSAIHASNFVRRRHPGALVVAFAWTSVAHLLLDWVTAEKGRAPHHFPGFGVYLGLLTVVAFVGAASAWHSRAQRW